MIICWPKHILSLVCIVLTGCVGTIPSDRFLNFDVQSIAIDVTARELDMSDTVRLNENLDECLISDSLIICLSNTRSCLFDVFELTSGTNQGSFCHVGRAREEALSSLPLRYLFQNDNGDLCADVFSMMDGKLMTWNISASILSGKDEYDRICYLDNEKFPPFSSVLRLEDNRILALDTGVSYSTVALERVPDYKEYDLSSLSLKRSLNLFKEVVSVRENDRFPSIVYYNSVDCLCPNADKLVVAMNFMPVISIVDLNSGLAKGYRLKGEKDFSFNEPSSYFVDVQADENFIYALFSGQKIDFEKGLKQPEHLLVMNWSGQMVGKYHLKTPFTRIHLNGERLYFTHRDGLIASVPVSGFDTKMVL